MQLTLSLAERMLSNDEPWSVVHAQRNAIEQRRGVDCWRMSTAWITSAEAESAGARPRAARTRETIFQPTTL